MPEVDLRTNAPGQEQTTQDSSRSHTLPESSETLPYPPTRRWHPHPRCADDDCREEGECTLRDGDCVADSDQDCRQSEACFEEGRCTVVDEECVATRFQDCQASQLCRDEGRCYLNAEDDRCDDGTERNSTGLMVGGIVISGVGGAGMVTGLMMVLISPFAAIGDAVSGGNRAEDLARAGGITAGVGLGVGLAGIPLAVVGASRVPRQEASPMPRVAVSPTGGSLTWSF
jgi:hypothetical protein